MAHSCPKCNSQRIHRSHRKGVTEHAVRVFGLRSRRCHECSARFVTLGQSAILRNDVERVLRTVSLAVLAAIAVVMVVGAVVWLSRIDGSASACSRGDQLAVRGVLCRTTPRCGPADLAAML
jgi:hypothetical protein